MPNKICLNCFKAKGDFDVCPHCGWVEDTPPEQAYHLCSGVILADRYVIGTVIGFGGFGTIYKSWDSQLGTVVAVKEFYPSGLVNRVPGEKQVLVFSGEKRKSFDIQLARFLDEAQNIAKFNKHPNIVNVYSFFEENNTAYIVMEYMEGMSLSEYLKKSEGKLPPEEAVAIVEPVMDALSAIHAQGIIHRDIHPGNIFITEHNQIKLLDFGAAKLDTGEDEKTLTVIVTQGYASPEQYRSKSKQGPYTDIYGLGATLYKVITGEVPEEAVDRQLKDKLKKPSETGVKLDGNLDRAIMKALAIKPDLRFQSAEEFKNAVQNKKTVDFPEIEYKRRRFRRILVTSLLSVLLCAAVVITSLYYAVWKPKDVLDGTKLTPDTVSVWIPVKDEADKAKQTGIYSSIKASFEERYSQLKVEMVPVLESEYDKKLKDAIAVGEAPDVFDYNLYSGDIGKNTVSLDPLIDSLNLSDYLFLSDYEKLYPSMRALPTGFNLMVLYGNTQAASAAKTTTMSEVTKWDDLFADNASMQVMTNSYGNLLALYSSDLINKGKIAANEDTVNRVIKIRQSYLKQQFDLSKAPLESFKENKLMYMLGDTSALKNIQSALPGYYSVVPLQNGKKSFGGFTNEWSVSNSSSQNRQQAAMLFLGHMLNEHSQNVLYLQNDAAIPLNKITFNVFVSANSDLTFLNDKIEDVYFVGEYQKVLNEFNMGLYDNVFSKEVGDTQIKDYLNKQ